MSKEQQILAAEQEQKLLDRPAEERLRDELQQQENAHRVAPGPQKPAVPAKPNPTYADPAEKPKTSRKWLLIVVLVGIALVAIALIGGYLPRRDRRNATARAARREAESLAVVDVAKVRRSSETSRLLLPGNITPITEAPIYARAAGYISKRFVDIGDHVKANQLMALIEAPDLDQQVSQGRSQVAQARQQLGQSEASLQQNEAQLELARVTWDRYRTLVQHGAVSKQDADTQKANFDTSTANVTAAKANVRAAEDNVRAAQANLERLIALQSYKEVRAPFAGVVTVRNVDLGTYISTSGGQSGSTTYASSQQVGSNATAPQNGEMFRIAQIGRLRILINVPQANATGVKVGQHADILVAEKNGQRYPGLVTRTSNTLDPTTRTLLTEVQVDNSKQELLPGMYAEVQFASPRANPPILVPGDSLISNGSGTFVAVLQTPDSQKLQTLNKESPDDTGTGERHERPKQIHMQKVDVGRDYGTDIEIIGGLQGWEYVVTSPSDQVYDGALILPSSAKVSQSAAPGGQTDKSPRQSGGGTAASAPAGASSAGGSGSGKPAQ